MYEYFHTYMDMNKMEAIMDLVNRELENAAPIIIKNKITAEELLKMPKDLRSSVIQEQVHKSVKFFEQIVDHQEIIDY